MIIKNYVQSLMSEGFISAQVSKNRRDKALVMLFFWFNFWN